MVLCVVLVVVGVALAVLGIIYLTVAAPDLPSFIPGHVAEARRKRTYNKRGILALVLAAVAFVLAYLAARSDKGALTR
jgi:hypothetical protein